MKHNLTSTQLLAQKIRVDSLRMVYHANASHIGTCLSIADLLAVLYGSILRVDPKQPDWPDRDRFLLSKGHAAAIQYATLAECGFFPVENLEHYCDNGSLLSSHIRYGLPGVEFSTGSLGHALPVACGIALAGKHEERPYRIYTLMSDGELDEGSNWEAILFAPHHKLDNLIAIVDLNKIQAFGKTDEVLNLEPLVQKWQAFGWSVCEIDGHNHTEIANALGKTPFTPGKPSVIIAHTIKGKGVSFMENQLVWHYKSPNSEQLAQALEELGETE